MFEVRDTLARRYAQALIRYYALSHEEAYLCWQVGEYFMGNSATSFFLRISSILPETKIAIILRVTHERVADASAISALLQGMLYLLKCDARLALFPYVCHMVYREYQRQYGIESCVVSLSHEMAHNEIQHVILWLQEQLKKTLQPSYTIDPDLIAGIRVRGQTFVWEDSVARSLRRIKRDVREEWGIV